MSAPPSQTLIKLFYRLRESERSGSFHIRITPPLRGSRGSRAGPLSTRPELVEGCRRGRRRLMRWGDFNALPYAGSVTKHVRVLHRTGTASF